MTEKKTSIGEFAEYARNVKMYQRNMSNYQQQGEYIKSLFEVSSGQVLVPFFLALKKRTVCHYLAKS